MIPKLILHFCWLGCLLGAAPLAGQSVWNTTTGNWSVAGNWAPAGVPVSGPALHLRFNATSSFTSTNDLGPLTVNRLTLSSTGNNTLTLAAASAANTLTFDGASPTLDVTGTTRFTGLLAGAATITKTGAGTFILDSNSSAFTGTIVIDGGRFAHWAGNSQTAPPTHAYNPAAIIVNNGGTYQFGNAGIGTPTLPATTYVTVNSGGKVSWQESRAFGGFQLNGGTIELTGGTATANGASAQTWTHGTLAGNALIGNAYSLAGSAAVVKTTGGTLTLSGAVSVTSSGGLKIQEGTVVLPHALNLGTAPLTFGESGKTGTLEYQGASAARAGNLVRPAGGAGVVRVTQASTILALSGANSGSGTLVKAGAGTLHLTGSLGANGNTQVQEGTLRVNAGLASGAFLVDPGATLAVNAGSGATSFSVPTLLLSDPTSVLRLDLDTAVRPAQALVSVRNPDGLILGESAVLQVGNAQAFAPGSYVLIDYDGWAIESGFELRLAGRTTGSLIYDTENTRLLLDVTGTDSVQWTGAAGGVWDRGSAAGVGGTANWRLAAAGTATNYIDTDTVRFDDTAAGFSVQLDGPVSPQALTVQAEADYVFAGPGRLTGTTGLAKSGGGTLTLATDNDYSGGTNVTGGTLRLGDGGTRGSLTGALNLTGSTLAFNRSAPFLFDNVLTFSGTNTLRQEGAGTALVESRLTLGATTLNLDGAGTLDLAGPFSGTGVIRKHGSGHVNLLGLGGSFTGTLDIHGGTVQLTDRGAGGDLNAVSILVQNGGTFIFGPDGNPDLPSNSFVTVRDGGLFDLKTGESYGGIVLDGGEYRTSGGNAGASSTGEASVAGSVVYDLRSGLVSTAFTGSGNGGLLNQSGGGVLLKQSAGTVTFGAGVSLASSLAMRIEEGILAMTPASVPATGTAVVSGGALAGLQLGGATTAGTLRIDGSGSAASARALSLGEGGGAVGIVQAGTVLSFTGAVSGSGPLTKTGAGTLNLYGTLGGTGLTTVQEGLLRLKPGTAAGGVAVAAGATLALNQDSNPGTLHLPALSLAEGAVLQFEFNTPALPGSPLLQVGTTDGLSVAGSVRLRLSNAQPFATGTYTLLDYAGSALPANFTLEIAGRSRATLIHDAAGTAVRADILQGEPVRWTGASSGVWDTGTGVDAGGSRNWQTLTSLAATNFVEADFVHFDDSAVLFQVELADAVRPNRLQVEAAADYAFGGAGRISGLTALAKSGTGTLILATDNDFTGGTTVTAGTLQLGNGGTRGAITGPAVLTGGRLSFNRADAHQHSGAITLNEGASLMQRGSGAVTVSGPLTVNANVSVVPDGTGLLTISSALALGANALSVSGSGDLTLSGVVSGSAVQPIVMTGDGTLYLRGVNSFTGTTVIRSGTVSVAGDRGLGASTADVLLDGGTLQLTAGTLGGVSATARSITVGEAGGALDFHSAQNFQGSGFFGTGTVTKTGPGEWSVGSNVSTFSGEIRILEGTLMMTSAQLNSARNLLVAAGAQFAINDDAAGTWSLAAGGRFTLNGDGNGTGALRQYNGSSGAAANNTFTTAFNRDVVLGSERTLIRTEALRGTLAFTSAVTGDGGLVKNGPGTLTLSSGASTYAGGTWIDEGLLVVSNASGSATGPGSVRIASGASLRGSGRIGGDTTIAGGALVQGGTNAARGTLSFGAALTLLDGSRSEFRLGGNGSSDRLVAGTLSLDPGAVLRVLLGYSPAAGDRFDLLDWSALGSGGDSDWTDNLDLSGALLAETLIWDTSLFNSEGVLSVALVPEPSRLFLLGLGGAGLILRRRRREPAAERPRV